MAYQPRYYSPEQLERIVRETEQELDRRATQRADADRLEKVRQWAADPSNAQQLASIRAEFDKVAPKRPTQPHAPVHPQASSAPNAPGYKTRAQLEAERPWLRGPQPGAFSRIVDPLVK